MYKNNRNKNSRNNKKDNRKNMHNVLLLLFTIIVIYFPHKIVGQAAWLGGLYSTRNECVSAVKDAQQDPELLRMIEYSSGDMMGQISFMSKLANFDFDNDPWTEEADFFFKHSKSMGDPDACKNVDSLHYCSGAIVLDGAESAYMEGFAPYLGICIPKQCDVVDIQMALNSIAVLAGRESLPARYNCGDVVMEKTSGTYKMYFFLCFLAFCIFIGSFLEGIYPSVDDSTIFDDKTVAKLDNFNNEVDILQEDDEEEDENDTEMSTINNTLSYAESKENMIRIVEGKEEVDPDIYNNDYSRPTSLSRQTSAFRFLMNSIDSDSEKENMNNYINNNIIVKFFKCFSLYTNLRLLNSKGCHGAFHYESFDGIKVLSMMWIIISHQIIFQSHYLGFSNMEDVYPPDGIFSTVQAQLLDGHLGVDTFFFISAFLGTLSITKFFKKHFGENRRVCIGSWLPKLYLHRYLRLTPVYMFTILFYMTTFRTMFSSPYSGIDRWFGQYSSTTTQNCEDNWVYNILYIHNFLPVFTQCYFVSWYMANLVQFFVFLPILALIYMNSRRIGYVIPSVLLFLSTIYQFYFTYQYSFSNYYFDPERPGYFYAFYMMPYGRCQSYLIGVICSYVWIDLIQYGKLDKFQEYLDKRKGIVTSLFVLSFIFLSTAALMMYPAYHNEKDIVNWRKSETPGVPLWYDCLNVIVSRPLWVSGIAILTFLFSMDKGGFIKLFMEMHFFHVLGKLTYCVYCIHPMIIEWYLAETSGITHFGNFSFTTVFFGITVQIYIFALLLHLGLERPCQNLQRMLFSSMHKHKNNQNDNKNSSLGVLQKNKQTSQKHLIRLDSDDLENSKYSK